MDGLKVTYTIEEIAEMALTTRYHSLALRETLLPYIAELMSMAYPDQDINSAKLVIVLRDTVLKQLEYLLESDAKISESLQQKILDDLKRDLNLP